MTLPLDHGCDDGASLMIAPMIDAAPTALTLHLALDGWEGPLDLLLDLARRQKVDLHRISILDLVDQYLAYIAQAEVLRLELAGDYLVMAAWLAFLKSALLLPKEEQPDPDPEELALRLQWRLARLAAMRDAAARLMARDLLGRDVFARGTPEGLRLERKALWQCSLHALLGAYGAVKTRAEPVFHHVQQRGVITLETALARVSAMLETSLDWIEIRSFLPLFDPSWRDGEEDSKDDPRSRRSALASSFLAALELARLGKADLAQDQCFGPLHLRRVLA